MPSSLAAKSFSEALPTLFEQVFSIDSSYLDCVISVVDALRASTNWDRAIYSEIRRVPGFSEVVYISEDQDLSRNLYPSDIPLPDFSVVDFVERNSGHLEVSQYDFKTATPLNTVPNELQALTGFIQGFLATHGVLRGTYFPRRLTPNFATMLSLHRCSIDVPLSQEDQEAVKLAHIVLREIVQRKRWRFKVPGRSDTYERIMPLFAAGWDLSRIAKTLERPLPEVQAMCNHIMIELENQYGIRTPEAAIIFLRGELAKPV